GYFRREWKLAVDRTSDMAASRAFIMPVLIDEIPAGAAEVPEEFLRYQWTTLAKGVASPEFVSQLKRLLESPRPARPADLPAGAASPAKTASAGRHPVLPWVVAGVVAVAAVAVVLLRSPAPAPVPNPAPKNPA